MYQKLVRLMIYSSDRLIDRILSLSGHILCQGYRASFAASIEEELQIIKYILRHRNGSHCVEIRKLLGWI